MLMDLIHNAALLIALGLIYDILFSRKQVTSPLLNQLISGSIIGAMAVALMQTPVKLDSGIIFDTRTTLLGLTGLFFGNIPTILAMAIASVYRFYLGGVGAPMGIATIVSSGFLGLAWRHYRFCESKELPLLEIYLFGLIVHLAMILCMFLLPHAIVYKTINSLALPVLTIYPISTMLLGILLVSRQRRFRTEKELLTLKNSLKEQNEKLQENEEELIAQNDELVATEEMLRQQVVMYETSQTFLKTVLDAIPVPVFYKDEKRRYTGANSAFERFYGVSREDIVGKTVFAIGSKEFAEFHNANDLELLQNPGKQIYETQVNNVEGEIRDVILHKATFTGVSGNIGGIVGAIMDITERKQAEESLKVMRFCVDHAGDSMFWINIDGRILYVNDAACAGLGYDREELLSMCIFDLDPDYQPNVWGPHFEDLKRKGNIILETRHRAKDGRIFPIEVNANYVHFGDREFNFAFTRDITERKRELEERLKLEQQLLHAQKLESLGVLAGGIAHDFNNILTSIIGNADLALRRINPESPAVDNLHNIETASARAADLARQMLAYSGKGKFDISNHDINNLLEEMLHILQVSISKKAVLRLNLTRPLPPIEADATQIRQVIMNLVINASEAIGDKSGVIAITTGCMNCDKSYLKEVWLDEKLNEGLYIFIEIADTGCGMSKETVSKLFEPFFTTKFTGRGLGMAAVLGIVRGHKGAIKIYTEPGKGSSFKILIPASGKPVEIFNHDTEDDQWKGSGTVLVVDDEETVRALAVEMLKELGFDVVAANDGREAIEAYKAREDIKFVILDLTMPHMDGEQCFRELRALNPNVKVIMSSGFTELEVTQKFIGKGLAGFLQKPYKLSALRESIVGLNLQ